MRSDELAERTCHYCGGGGDLRPYGPGGTFVCFPCGTSPEHEETTKGAFGALLDANSVIGGGVVTLSAEEGLTPGLPLLGGA